MKHDVVVSEAKAGAVVTGVPTGTATGAVSLSVNVGKSSKAVARARQAENAIKFIISQV